MKYLVRFKKTNFTLNISNFNFIKNKFWKY